MPLHKNNSRQSDRNKIFKMNAQGYSIEQIQAKLSITSEHVSYILNQYESDLKERRANSPELQERARIQKEVEDRRKGNAPANPPDLVELKEQLRKEILAELKADAPVPTPITPEPDLDEYKHVTVAGEDEPAPKAKHRRKRKA